MYRPEKGNDFKFLDRAINEQFQVGGTDCFVHKYLGPVNPEEGTATPAVPNNSSAIPELGIQDLLLMENRDRHYDPDVYIIRGIYTMQDLDFNLSQFGLFLNNDNIMINFHLRSSFDALGRKIMAGDVIELPHQKDEFALDDSVVALKRFYVVSEVTRPASGYSQTWYPHLVRAKCQPLVDSQEFKEILDQDSGAEDGSTLRDLISTYQKNIEINNQIVAQAAADVGESGYDTRHMYVVPKLNNETVDVLDVSMTDTDASIDNPALDASIVFNSPTHNYYVGYLTGDGIPPNGAYFGQGLTFPGGPVDGQFYLRTDYMPNRLFRYDGRHWVKFEDDVRMTISTQGATQTTDPTKVKQTQKSSFINNTNTATIAGEVVTERQALSKALRPRADN
jgi:molybdopterin converting factor small subunit